MIDTIDDPEERIEMLESRLEWLQQTTVEDIEPPDDADPDVVRGGLKLRRRAVSEELEELRDERAELTNDEEDSE